ncbi:tRNA splicing endonuclease subunit sen2 [Emydomyces testavorans]|uniref:tRNA-splicing endonuclease subunit Sen2 n=1 Tax=Emydomyces testavorans TaxID=2070801 RepID=A0AAF0DDD7_9EURO|nr:tRNA splicing endonuclease subunit sen2 [Emydomyces testavorans]
MASSAKVTVKESGCRGTAKGEVKNDTSKNRMTRQRRLNYKHIHRFLLPLTVHPLPPLIPHNPLSIISIALSYLTYFVSPPHHEVYSAYFDIATSSVHVTDPKTIRALWEMGFFGKGSLSRSEPTWLEREKKRRGLLGVDTSEEATGNRRTERREWKLERARKEKEAIAEQLRVEATARNGHSSVAAQSTDNHASKVRINGYVDSKFSREASDSALDSTSLPKPDTMNGGVEKPAVNGTKIVRFSSVVDTRNYEEETVLKETSNLAKLDSSQVKDEEHLQLSSEEAFFLVYGLGVLQVYEANMKTIMSTSDLVSLFRRHSYFPPRDEIAQPEPDDRFIVSYVAYHHFRSLGWVVRSGVKFGVDLLLYNRGPVFSHAEFAVVLLPAYEHPYWNETEERRAMVAKKVPHNWWWLHCVNRVQAQVKKSLILCYVEIPPPPSPQEASEELDIGALLKTYTVREMSIKRWVPNRSRD